MYAGIIAEVPLGDIGLHTDDNYSKTPPNSLVIASNITTHGGKVEKDYGSRKWNSVALSAGIVAAYDFWPDDSTQRVIVVTRDGTVTKYSNYQTPVTLITGLSIGDPPVFVAGGAESAGRNRKLFLLTGNNPIQVLSGDGTTMSAIANPSTDWGTSYPTAGVIHRNRFCVLGNSNFPHQLYMSDPANHENFTSNNFNFTVYPGEGEALFAAYVYKSRLFMGKYPEGLYYLVDTDPTFTNWYMTKFSAAFGVASRSSFIEALNTLLVANSFGSITIGMASYAALGAFETDDLLKALRNERYMRENMSTQGRKERSCFWYGYRKTAYFTYRSSSGIKNDRILQIEFSGSGPELQNLSGMTIPKAKVTWNDRDQANFIFGKKNPVTRILKPCYGAEDGFIYEMDQENRDVGGVAFTGTFQTPAWDFGWLDPKYSEKQKLFDFLELTFEERGNWVLNVDVFIDKEYVETLQFTMTVNEYLDNLTLDVDDVVGKTPQAIKLPLHGSGRRISFKCYNGGLDQKFAVISLRTHFRMAGDNQGGGTR